MYKSTLPPKTLFTLFSENAHNSLSNGYRMFILVSIYAFSMARKPMEPMFTVLQQRSTTGNSNIFAQTGNTCVSGTTIDSVEIPTTILEFSTMASSKKVPIVIASATENRKYQYGRQNRKYLYLWNCDRYEGRSKSSATRP